MKNEETAPTAKQHVLHPGSSIEDAKALGGEGDFGVPESNVIGRTYTSQNTKHADPGNAVPRAGAGGSRTSGVGGNRSGVGSSSGGDLDTDIIGVGADGSAIAASGKIHEPSGADEAQETSNIADTGSHLRRSKSVSQRPGVHGSTVQSPDERTVGAGTGADAVTNSARRDDSFAGEVSSDEASGRNDAE